MTQWTDYAENALADKLRGTEPTYPTNWYIGFGSAATDSSFTEITGTDLPRIAVARSLANWAGTQGPGTTVASSGTSHQTSNNNDIAFSTAASNRGTSNFIGIFDALTSGHCWAWIPNPTPQSILSGDAPTIAAGTLLLTIGATGGVTDFLANKLIDEFFRAQAYAWPANTYLALYTGAPTNAGGGTEVAGGSYARVALASSTTALSGTQSAGSTSASSGTGGRISNNATLTYPAPTADWGAVVAEGQKDASTSGNLLTYGTFSARSIVSGGSAPSHAPNTLGFTLR